MLQCAVSCHLPLGMEQDATCPVGCNAIAVAYGAMPGGVVCHGRQHLMPSAVGPYVFPIVVRHRRRHGGAALKIPKVGDCRDGRSARPLQCKSRLEQAAA